MYSITVTPEELEMIRPLIPGAVEAAKPVRARKPKPIVNAAPFSPNTGNAAVDDFMRRKRDPSYKPLPLPKGKAFPPEMARGGDRRPLTKVLEDAIYYAKRNNWPGAYTGNFAAKKTRR